MKREAIAAYILASKKNGTLYIGVTSNLLKRTYEHQTKMLDGFTKIYNVQLLVYYELYDSIVEAIHREKRLKKYTRAAKIKLIERENPDWKDLYETLV